MEPPALAVALAAPESEWQAKRQLTDQGANTIQDVAFWVDDVAEATEFGIPEAWQAARGKRVVYHRNSQYLSSTSPTQRAEQQRTAVPRPSDVVARAT